MASGEDDGYGPDIDDALRRMERDSVTALTTHRQIAAFLVLARYYALGRFAALLAHRVDTEGFAVEGDRESIFDNLTELQDYAAREAAAYGYVMQAINLSQVGSANLPVDQEEQGSSWDRSVWDTGFLQQISATDLGVI